MKNRLATYIEAAFPYPAAYQSDGAGGLTLLPRLRIPTAIVQGQKAFPTSACAQQTQCPCHGRCGGCKRRLGGLGDPADPNDPNFDYSSLSFPDNSSSSTDPNAPSGAAFEPGGIFSDPSTFANGTPPFIQPPVVPSSGGGSSVPALINALSQSAGRIIASTRGTTPQQFAAQNPQLSPAQAAAQYPQLSPAQAAAQYQKLYGTKQQASFTGAGSGINTIVGGLPIWQWGLGLAGVAFVAAMARGGK